MMAPTLHIRLLGDFSLMYGDQQVTSLNTTRLHSLLAYLVLHRDFPQQRQHLAFLFWPVTPFHLDVAEFEQALTLADTAGRRSDHRAQQAALEQADSLFRGELLPGCYDEWILPERDRLHQHYLQVLEHLLRLFEGQGDYVTAIRYAQRLLALDPLSEDLYRRLMNLFALNNDRASALRVYPTCVTTLQCALANHASFS